MRRRFAASIVLIGAVAILAGGCASVPWSGGRLWSGAAPKENAPSAASEASENGDSANGEAPGAVHPHSAARQGSKIASQPTARKQQETRSGIGRAECSDAPPTGSANRPDSSQTVATGPSAEELHHLMQQLQELALLDPEAQKLLMEDLSKTDPALWKPLMERFRAALEDHRRLKQASANRGGPKTAASGAQENSHEDASPGHRVGTDVSMRTPAQTGNTKGVSEGPKKPGSSEKNADGSQKEETGLKTAAAASSHWAKGGSAEVTQAGYLQEAGTSDSPVSGLPPPTLQAARSGGPMESLTSLPASAGAGALGTNGQGQPGSSSPAGSTGGKPTDQLDQAGGTEQASWQQYLLVALREMAAGLSPSPQTDQEIARHVYYRLLCLAAGRREEALEPIPGVPPAMQDFWTHQLYAIQLLLDGRQIADRHQRAAEAKRLFQEAVGKLSVAAPLVVRGLAFATEVQSFGCYGGLEKYEFQPGQELLLYAEVENFQSQPTPKGYHTKLRSRFQIFNAEGQSVVEQEFPITEEYCRQMRRDFFIAYPVRLPLNLSPGQYTLKLSLEDLHRGEVCQGTIQFNVRKSKS